MKRNVFRHVIWACGLLALSTGLCGRAHADAISYALTLCENLDVLKDPMNKTLAMNAGWKPQHTLMMERTSPYVELRNTSEEARITHLSMSIGDLSKNFDWAKMIEVSPGVTMNVESVDAVMGGTSTDTLKISFTGFDPGDYVRFRMGIAADDPNAGYLQDYRMILFKLDGGPDISGNSTISVDFASINGTGTLTDQLQNFTMGGMPTSTNMNMPHQYNMDMVMPFTHTNSGTIEPMPPVPEPGSMVLLGIGLVGLVGMQLRRRRRVA